MRTIGIDLDNTLIDYRGVFHRHAVARGLIPADVPDGKDDVRDYLRSIGRDEDFTLLQGYVYGPGLSEAKPYPSALACISALQASGARVAIISHKTPRPFRGPPYDLQASAREWLAANGIVGAGAGQIPASSVFLEPTKQAKVDRIIELNCDVFIDDLPEFLAEPGFPAHTRRILFDPDCRATPDTRWDIAHDWEQIRRMLLP
jgi:hypothetical protein